jgi:hypothetical protein
MLLHLLPPIVHIRRESDKAAMRWSLERLREELRDPQPGGSLIAQQLAYMMLIQALRLYLADATTAGRGWLSALSDKHMGIAITSMHREILDIPGRCNRWPNVSVCRALSSRCAFARRLARRLWNTSRAGACFWLQTG